MSGNYLRQSTASQSRSLGPFVDDTDFKTAETALTILNTDIKLLANGGASANKSSGGGTHRVNGIYGVTFDATDTATVGELEVSVVVAGAAPYKKTFTVLEEAVYDALFAASAGGYVTPIPTGPVPALGIYLAGTMQAGSTSTTAVLAAGTTIADNLINNGFLIYIYEGTGAGQAREVTDWTDSSDTAVVNPAWQVTPDNTSKYVGVVTPPAVSDPAVLPLVRAYDHTGTALALATELAGAVTSLNTLVGRLTNQRALNLDNLAVAPATNTDMGTLLGRVTVERAGYWDNLSAGVVPTAAQNASATWEELIAGHLGAGKTGAALNAAGSSGDPWATPLPGAYGAGTAGNIMASRASQASVDAVDDFLDTEIAAIKAKTDNLPADPTSALEVTAQFGVVNAAITVVDDFLDTEISAIKARTDALPADTAAALTAIDDFLDTEIAAIKAKTDQLTFGTGATAGMVKADLAGVVGYAATGDPDTPVDIA